MWTPSGRKAGGSQCLPLPAALSPPSSHSDSDWKYHLCALLKLTFLSCSNSPPPAPDSYSQGPWPSRCTDPLPTPPLPSPFPSPRWQHHFSCCTGSKPQNRSFLIFPPTPVSDPSAGPLSSTSQVDPRSDHFLPLLELTLSKMMPSSLDSCPPSDWILCFYSSTFCPLTQSILCPKATLISNHKIDHLLLIKI